MITTYVRPFDRRDPRYRCCCGMVSSICGAVSTCALDVSLALVIIFTVGFAYTGLSGADLIAYRVTVVTLNLMMVVAAVLTAVGLCLKRSGYLIIHLLMRVLFIFGTVLASIAFGVSLSVLQSEKNPHIPTHVVDRSEYENLKSSIEKAFIVQCVLYSLLVIVNVWLFTVLLAAYRYLRDKRPVLVSEFEYN